MNTVFDNKKQSSNKYINWIELGKCVKAIYAN